MYHINGVVERFNVKLVSKGYSQYEGVGYYDTFSPIAKIVSVGYAISLAIYKGWSLFQIDIYNAFL